MPSTLRTFVLFSEIAYFSDKLKLVEYQNLHEYNMQITSKVTIALFYKFKLWGNGMLDLSFLNSEIGVEFGIDSHGA